MKAWLVQFVEYALLGVALGCLGIYAYETVEARRFQSEQAAAFERAASAASPSRVRAGGLVGMLDVPRLRLTTPVVEGDDDRTLNRAVGHLPDTPLPWEKGNSALAGHRDGLFRPLKDVKVGDEIRFRTTREQLRYRVTEDLDRQARRCLGAAAGIHGNPHADYLLSVQLRRFSSEAFRGPRRAPIIPLKDRIVSGSV